MKGLVWNCLSYLLIDSILVASEISCKSIGSDTTANGRKHMAQTEEILS